MNTTISSNLSAADLRRAADLRDQIDSLQSELEALLGGKPSRKQPGPKPGGNKPGPKPKAKKAKRFSA